MARAFRCKTCRTGYTTTGKDIPPGIKWDDGNECELVEVESFMVGKTTYTMEDMDNSYDKGVQDERNGLLRPCTGHSIASDEEEARELRMKHIGQNGNDGLHYGREEDDFNG